METPRGLFAGLCTLDIVQLVDHVPGGNEKVTAREQTVAAGGPVANAAVTFAHLGGRATLLTAVGGHPLAAGIRADLERMGVELVDLAGDEGPPVVSAIMVTARTGARAVVSTDAGGRTVGPPDDLAALVAGCDIVQADPHYPALVTAVLAEARRAGKRTVLDTGRWKPATERLLPDSDVVVAPADFHPPGTTTPAEALDWLTGQGVPDAAITRGAEPILLPGGEIPVPRVAVADTLGAGDVFHGALTFHLAAGLGFEAALGAAASVAARACGSFGARAWMTEGRS
jgi:sugar/nucleoside kinase (ribokinase family)